MTNMTKPLILASQSPRRKELLDLLQLPYSIIVSEVEEKLNRNFSPEENVQWLAKQKAKAVADLHPHAIVIGADTMVCLDGECLGKPQDQEEAASMLRRLSGRSHSVITAVSIQAENHSETFYDKTEVAFWSSVKKRFGRILKQKSRWIKQVHTASKEEARFL